jgi:hypothetical protein
MSNADDKTDDVQARITALDAERHAPLSPAEEIAARQDEMWARMRGSAARMVDTIREERQHEETE